jgi:hypothetical protein
VSLLLQQVAHPITLHYVRLLRYGRLEWAETFLLIQPFFWVMTDWITAIFVFMSSFAEFVPASHQYLLVVLSIWWAFGQLIGSLVLWFSLSLSPQTTL